MARTHLGSIDPYGISVIALAACGTEDDGDLVISDWQGVDCEDCRELMTPELALDWRMLPGRKRFGDVLVGGRW